MILKTHTRIGETYWRTLADDNKAEDSETRVISASLAHTKEI